MADYISKIKLPGVENALDIADKTLGLSTTVSDDGNWSMNLVRDGEGLPDTATIEKDIQTLKTGKQNTITADLEDEALVI